MPEANDKFRIFYQNLIDAGCDESTVKRCMAVVKSKKYAELLRILTQYRGSLLKNIRSGQRQLDCLDYLIYKIKKESI